MVWLRSRICRAKAGELGDDPLGRAGEQPFLALDIDGEDLLLSF
ncbi:hypothetical protein [Reticulibacter mediterranei]|nr:hypothetical protein [Reticulibacter mediterranei]